MRLIRTRIGLHLLLICICLLAKAQEQKTLTVTGKLVRVMGIGGESTGWAIQLESQIMIDGKQVDSIEAISANQEV